MPARFERPCRERGCFERTRDISGFCAKHLTDNSYLRDRNKRSVERHKNDPTWKLYKSVAWSRLKEALFGYGNVICQRIVDGRRCTHPVEQWHHIISPRERESLFYTPSNLVGVCHHSRSLMVVYIEFRRHLPRS